MERESSAPACLVCRFPERALGESSYEAVVIGSGYGGSVAAFRLAEAGVKVCLLEKGRRWEAHEFPTTALQTLRTTRFHTPLGAFGKSNSLYQAYFQGTVIALVAAGLGGGSLINGGVALPTPARARRDPRWPEQWRKQWDASEARARSMLQAESAPSRYNFHQDRVLDAVAGEIEDSTRDCIELSVRFKDGIDPVSGVPYNACVACGSCITGCPYNAKNSADKNYIAAATKAGCTIRTSCEARFVLPNFDYAYNTKVDGKSCRCEGHRHHIHRRWRVYLDEIQYITTDYVVVAAGVLGTTNLLMQSKIRGLTISNKLGHGLSCNGNSAAFVCGTHVATKGHSLSKKEVDITPMFNRPGPSITSSYTSSLGFTIQGAVLPNGFSFVFFKCIAHRGFWFGLLYGLWHKMKRMLRLRNSDSLIFTIMGHDAADGRLEFDIDQGFVKFFPPTDSLIPKKIRTIERIAKRIGGQMFMPTLRNTTVHLLGGCRAGGSPYDSVTNPDGQLFCPLVHSTSSWSDILAAEAKEEKDKDNVGGCGMMDNHVHDGLYVCDASIIPCAVGVNPSFTITTVAEHVTKSLVKDAVGYYKYKVHENVHLVENENKSKFIPNGSNSSKTNKAAGARVWETLTGRIEGLPCTLNVVMDMGSAESRRGILKGRVGGKFRMRALETGLLHIVDGSVDMCFVNRRAPFSQYMNYHLLLVSETGAMYELNGKKEMKPFLMGATAFTESRTLELDLRLVSQNFNSGIKLETEKGVIMRGAVQASYMALLRSIISMRGPRRWQFVSSLLLSLFHTYFAPSPRLPPSAMVSYVESPSYPQYTVHSIKAEDGAEIVCWRWLPSPSSVQTSESTEEDSRDSTSSRCVLLLNGYSGESYTLPTEEDDLVRTLLNKGYEVWLLRMRLHFSVCTVNPFSLDDIARFDLPADIYQATGGKQHSLFLR